MIRHVKIYMKNHISEAINHVSIIENRTQT
jgi:hypothetical protein